MIQRTSLSAALLTLSSIFFLVTGPATSVHADSHATASKQQAKSDRMTGTVTDILDAAGYTYAEIDNGKEKVWAAGPATPLKAGDEVSFSTRMPMSNFHSNSLNRDFPILYFTDVFLNAEGAEVRTMSGPATRKTMPAAEPAAEPAGPVEKLADGQTIAEIHDGKEGLNEKTVRVRGKVTKFNAGIMGRNWLHISDATTGDLTVTTDDTAAVGDIVVIEGQLQLDKDFGYGYSYPLIVENAKVSKE